MAIVIVTELLFLDPHNASDPKATENTQVIAYDSGNTPAEKALRTDDEIKSTIAGEAKKALLKAYPHFEASDVDACILKFVEMAVDTMNLEDLEDSSLEPESSESLALYRIKVPFDKRKSLIGGSVQYLLWHIIDASSNEINPKKLERKTSVSSMADVASLLT